jgi:L-ascorbate metabolism protein UlaG (beta-lactamase superfamily)
MVKFMSFSSGSCGNCYYLGTEEGGILIDAGVSLRRVKRTLMDSGLSLDSFSAILVTHDHLDHLDPDTVVQIRDEMHFITTHGGREKLHSLGKAHVTALSVGESITVGDFEITAVFAAHTVEAFGVVVKAEGFTLYFSGDTLYHEELFEIAKFFPDVTFLCINGRLGNMNVEEALEVAKHIGASCNVPTHYDMFASNSEDPHLFADRITGGAILEFDGVYEFLRQGTGAFLALKNSFCGSGR